jgi:hypothetical protein
LVKEILLESRSAIKRYIFAPVRIKGGRWGRLDSNQRPTDCGRHS